MMLQSLRWISAKDVYIYSFYDAFLCPASSFESSCFSLQKVGLST